MIGGGTRKTALVAALLAWGASPAAPADLRVPRLPAGMTCESVRAQMSLLPPSWTEAMIRRFVRGLGYSDKDLEAAKRCATEGKR